MGRTRLVFAILLMLAGVLLWAVMGFQMMLTVAYGMWGLAFLFCMGTAVATGLCYAGWKLLTFRDPLQDLASIRATRMPPPVPPPAAPAPVPPRD